jgi:hypothetical protein
VVEDLDDLGAEAARVLVVAADRVLAGDAALLVRGGAQWQVVPRSRWWVTTQSPAAKT